MLLYLDGDNSGNSNKFELPVKWIKLSNITGSRNQNGNVPNANWNYDKFNVNYCNSDNRNDNIRARSEVSA